ncbi:hypothetical protein C7M52_00797 [Mixta theicola]|nr:Ig-like domain-containing protein [Mixta theicola]QHM74854.1 hypothetical protein C7M52_00797 [Mixta theicola]
MTNTTLRQQLTAALSFSENTLLADAAPVDLAATLAAITSGSHAEAFTVLDSAVTINPVSGDNKISINEHGEQTIISGYVNDGALGGEVLVTLNGKTYTGTLDSNEMWFVSVPKSDMSAIADGEVVFNVEHTDGTGVHHQKEGSFTLASDPNAHYSPSLFIDKVTGDDVLSAVERGGDLLVSGWGRGIGEGYEVKLTLNGHTYTTKTTKDSRWIIAIPQEDLKYLPEGQLTLQASLGGTDHTAEAARQVTLTYGGADKETPVLTMDAISGDDNVSATEIGGSFYITGHAENIAPDSKVKLVIGDKVYKGTVTSDGVWSVEVKDLHALVNGGTTHATISYQDRDGNQFAATREIKTSAGSTESRNPINFEFETIGEDNQLSGEERHQDLTIRGTFTSGEGVGVGETVYVTLNGKTYTTVVQQSPDGNSDYYWQLDIPASDVAALELGSYTVVASLDATTDVNNQVVNSTQATTLTVVDKDIAINPISGDNQISVGEHGEQTIISGYANDGAPGETVLVTLNDKTYTGMLDNNNMWFVSVPKSDMSAIASGKVVFNVEHTDGAGVHHQKEGTFTLVSSDVNVRYSPSLFIDKVTGDDVLSAVERGGDLLVSGWGRCIGEGYEVKVTLNGHTYTTKTTKDSRWIIAIPQQDLQDLPEGQLVLLASLGRPGHTAEAARQVTLTHSGADKDTPVLTMDAISGDDNVIATEITGSFYVTGHAENIAPDSKVKLVIGDKVYKGIVTSDGVWSVEIKGLHGLVNGGSTHATISYQDRDGNQFATTREIKVATGKDQYRYPMRFEFEEIAEDNQLSGEERHQDLTIRGTFTSGEGQGVGETVYVTLNGKTYTTVAQRGASGNSDNYWQLDIPASDVAALTPGSYTVVASLDAPPRMGKQLVNSTQAKTLTVVDTDIAINPVSGDNQISVGEHGEQTIISGYVNDGASGEKVMVTLNGKTYTSTLDSNEMWFVSVPKSDMSAIANGKVVFNVEHTDGAGVHHQKEGSFALVSDANVRYSPSLFIDKVTGDDVLSAVERGGDLLVSGWGRYIGEGYEVKVTLNDHTYTTKTTKDSRWIIAIPQQDLQDLPEGQLALLASWGGKNNTAEAARMLTLTHSGADKETPVLTIDPISGDNKVDGGEIAGPFYVTGHAENIAAGSTVKLTTGDKIFTGTVTSDGVWSVYVDDLYSVNNAATTHATISYQDRDGNQFAATRVIETAAGGYPFHYPMIFAINPIGGDDRLSGAERHQDVTIRGEFTSGEGLGSQQTLYVTLNGKTYTTVVQNGADSPYDNYWRLDIPASDIESLTPGSYTVVASVSDWLQWSGSQVTQTQAKIIHIDENGVSTFSQSVEYQDIDMALLIGSSALGLQDEQPTITVLIDRLTVVDESLQEIRVDKPEPVLLAEIESIPAAPTEMWQNLAAAHQGASLNDITTQHLSVSENTLADLLQQPHLQSLV